MNRRTKKFFKSFFILFLIYIIIVPAVFFLLDSDTIVENLGTKPVSFVLKMVGIATSIALVISFWLSRDPEMKEW